MKVKVINDYINITSVQDERIDDKINVFIKDKKVIDIKYQDTVIIDRSGGFPQRFQSALIMYEELENE